MQKKIPFGISFISLKQRTTGYAIAMIVHNCVILYTCITVDTLELSLLSRTRLCRRPYHICTSMVKKNHFYYPSLLFTKLSVDSLQTLDAKTHAKVSSEDVRYVVAKLKAIKTLIKLFFARLSSREMCKNIQDTRAKKIQWNWDWSNEIKINNQQSALLWFLTN